MLPLTPDTHGPSSSKTYWPNPDKRDERTQTNASVLPVRGRGEMRNGHSNRHQSLINECNGMSCNCSSGSRGSSCSPQTPSSFDGGASGCIHSLDNASDTASPTHNFHSNLSSLQSPSSYQNPASLHSRPSMSFPLHQHPSSCFPPK